MRRRLNSSRQRELAEAFYRYPQAEAIIKGSNRYPGIKGCVRFFQTKYGVLLVAEVFGLPKRKDVCSAPVFAFHIHEGSSCRDDGAEPFAETLSHYNPAKCEHPYHAGDLPPLFSNNGYAFEMVLTNRFLINEVIEKTIVIHEGKDDFTTQPAGNAGEKIACGEIKKV